MCYERNRVLCTSPCSSAQNSALPKTTSQRTVNNLNVRMWSYLLHTASEPTWEERREGKGMRITHPTISLGDLILQVYWSTPQLPRDKLTEMALGEPNLGSNKIENSWHLWIPWSLGARAECTLVSTSPLPFCFLSCLITPGLCWVKQPAGVGAQAWPFPLLSASSWVSSSRVHFHQETQEYSVPMHMMPNAKPHTSVSGRTAPSKLRVNKRALQQPRHLHSAYHLLPSALKLSPPGYAMWQPAVGQRKA